MLNQINQVVATGSVDGVLTSAALLRAIGENNIGLEFAQAFTVNKVDPSTWQSGRKVAFVDLAVNSREPGMTVAFLRQITEAGHSIVGVLDEHNAEDWQNAFVEAGLNFDSLTVQPVSQDKSEIKSSGALLLSLLGSEVDEHTRKLCEAADSGDRMDFSTHFGGMVNQAVKSKIQDDTRRIHLAQHFATNTEADEKIQGWITEYEAILANHAEILASKQDLGEGFVRISTIGFKVDMTTLMRSLYQGGAKIVVCEGEMYNKSVGKPTVQIAFGTNDKSLNLLETVKGAGVNALGGFAQKANVEPDDEQASIEAIRKIV